MKPDHLSSLLHASARRFDQRTPDCPDETQIAAYVDGALPPIEHEVLEHHLADCQGCRALIGLLSGEREATPADAVPPNLMARAGGDATRSSSRRWRIVERWVGAAATLVIAAPLLVYLMRPVGPTPADSMPAQLSMRSLPTPNAGLQLLSPTPEAAVRTKQLDIRWTAVPGSSFYDVRILTDSGDVVAEQRVAGTEWKPAGDLGLSPGAEYYVHVDAYPAGDKAVGSDHVPFRVVE